MLFRIFVVFICLALIMGCAGTKKQEDSAKEDFEVVVKDVEGFHFIYYEFTGPYHKAWNKFPTLTNFLEINEIDYGPYPVGIYLDNPEAVNEENLRSEIGFMLKTKPEKTGLYKYKWVEPCKVAAARYDSWEDSKNVWNAIVRYMMSNGLMPGGAGMEFYYSEKGVDNEAMMPVVER